MACKTGGAGLNTVFSNFGSNQEKVFIMAYAPEFSGAVMTSAYDQLPLTLLFPLIGNDGGAKVIDSVIGRSWYAGGWLLHPDGHKEEVAYKENVLTAKLIEALADTCTGSATPVHGEGKPAAQKSPICVRSSSTGLVFTAPTAGNYRLSCFTLDGRSVLRRIIHSTGGATDAEVGGLADGTYAISIVGPSSSVTTRMIVSR